MDTMTVSFTRESRALQFYATLKAMAFRGISNIYVDGCDVHYDYNLSANQRTYNAVASILRAMTKEVR